MDSKPSPQEATEAAAKILGCYSEITASDPNQFASGLVETLMIYPLEVVKRAANPVHGIAGVIDRYDLTLAKIRKHMDAWAAERGNRIMIEQRRSTQLLPEPPRDPERDKRVCDGFANLSDYLSRKKDVA